MVKKQIENEIDIKKKFLAYFILFWPSIVIAAIPSEIDGNVLIALSIKILLAFYQFVVMKNFVDSHYD